MWNRLFFIMAIVTLHLGNGRLLFRDLCLEQKLDIDALALQTYYVQSEIYELGKTAADFNGVILPVYDRERTICDCFKYRSRLDNEIFNKALNAYVNDSKKDLRNLSEYAKKLRVHKKVTELMEVLLNG